MKIDDSGSEEKCSWVMGKKRNLDFYSVDVSWMGEEYVKRMDPRKKLREKMEENSFHQGSLSEHLALGVSWNRSILTMIC